jgi:hypothetical protein
VFDDRLVLLFDINAYLIGDCAIFVASVALLSASTAYSTSGAAEGRSIAALGCFDLQVLRFYHGGLSISSILKEKSPA